jgi:hypothetical protein
MSRPAPKSPPLSPLGGREVPQQAPSPERALIDAIEAGQTEGDDQLIEVIDGRTYEVLSDGRRVPLDD